MSNRKPATFIETRQLWIADEVKRIREIVVDSPCKTSLSDSDLGLIQTGVTTINKWRGEIYGHSIGMLDAQSEDERQQARQVLKEAT